MPTLYRRRFIPDETVALTDDEILYLDEGRLLITRWTTLNPRADFASGMSWYMLEEGFKISKFFKADGSLHYIYCDIIEHTFDRDANTYVFNDLLADVTLSDERGVQVLDIGELPEAYDSGAITIHQLKSALTKLSHLLDIIYGNQFEILMKDLESYLQ